MGVFGERHGMQKLPLSKYPNTFFRVSLKAVIENDAGEVLCVQEAGSEWTLPGGGLDHGETVEQGLRRELFEEVALDPQAPFIMTPIGHEVMWVESREPWQLWVLIRISFNQLPQFKRGADADDVSFIDPRIFAGSEWRAQQLIYKWLVEAPHIDGVV